MKSLTKLFVHLFSLRRYKSHKSAELRNKTGTISMALFDREFYLQLQRIQQTSKRRIYAEINNRGPRSNKNGEFHDHRAYVPGDDLKTIDWAAYRRLRKPYIKLSPSQEQRPVYIALDTSSSMKIGKTSKWDYARRLAAMLTFLSIRKHGVASVIGLSMPPKYLIKRLTDIGQFHDLCLRLESTDTNQSTSVASSLQSLPLLCPGRGLVFYISDFWDHESIAPSLSRLLNSPHEIVLLHLITPQEASPSLTGDWELEDMESGESITIHANPRSLKNYRQQFKEYVENIRKIALRQGAHYILASTKKPEIDLILSILNTIKI